MEPLDIRLADLTGRARIRHAAVRLFAAEGYAQTSLRSIAQAAEVSLALIAHHFGSKHQLRDAVDKWVLAAFENAVGDIMSCADAESGEALRQRFADHVGDILRARPEIRAYLRRMAVVDGSSNGAILLGSVLALIRRVVERAQPSCSERELDEQSLHWLLLLFGPALLEPILRRCMPASFAEMDATAAGPAGGVPQVRSNWVPRRIAGV